jgi:hypothetical protein
MCIVLEPGSLSSGFLILTATPILSMRAMMGKSSWQQLPKAMISASMVEVAVLAEVWMTNRWDIRQLK